MIATTIEELGWLDAIARIVTEGELDGLLFPAFIASFTQDTGKEQPAIAHHMARQVRQADERCLRQHSRHMSVREVRSLIEQVAA